jgi:S-formylglutathione hydrolase FrmB
MPAGSLVRKLAGSLVLGLAGGLVLTLGATAAAESGAAGLKPWANDPAVAELTYDVPAADGKGLSKALVIVPSDYYRKRLQPAVPGIETTQADKVVAAGEKRYSVVYLLHGYSGDYTNWYVKSKEAGRSLAALADRYGLILVMPDGKYSSWYLNAAPHGENPEDWQWETAMMDHLMPEIETRYRTWPERAGRGITGLSMGGHGALYLAIRHPEVFAAAGSMSGVMNLANSTQKYDLAKRLGTFDRYASYWRDNSVLTLVEALPGQKLDILIDCGVDDVFYPEHVALHEKLLGLKVPHDYFTRPGAHTWDYWVNALPYHLQFLSDRLRSAGLPDRAETSTPAVFPSFDTVLVDEKLPDDPYAVQVADMNADAKPDLVVARFNEVVWYQAPSWKRHSIVKDATRQNVSLAARDVDGDGRADLALGADWEFTDTRKDGSVWWIQGLGDHEGPWPVHRIAGEPNVHRVCWADTDGDGKPELIVVPLKGRETTEPHFAERGVRLLQLRVPKDPARNRWPMEVIDDSLHVCHGVRVVQFDSDPAQELLVTSFEGVHLLDRQRDGRWRRQRLCEGEQKTSPSRGSSEVALGRLRTGQRFIATIEPWHGHEVVVYLEPREPGSLWQRFVLDETFDAGHAVGCADFDGDGDDEIVAGYRGHNAGKGKPTSLKAYDPVEATAGKWATHWLDEGGMATEDLQIADVNADGRPDVVAVGRATRNVKLYVNRGHASEVR